MRKLLTTFALTLLLAASASAQQARRLFITSVPGADIGILENGFGIQYHQLTWNVVGTILTCTVELDQSADNITWSSTIIAGQTCTSNGASAVSALTVANYVRINVTAFTTSGGGSVSVTYLGFVTIPGGGGTIGGTVTASHLSYASGAATLADVSGSAVTGGTGAISLTASGDAVTPFEINSHSSTQSVQLMDMSMNSGTAGLGVSNIRGLGLGKWSDGGGTMLLHLMADAPANLAPVGWVVSNNRSGYNSNGSPSGAVSAYCSDVGLCQIVGGGTDANGNYVATVFDPVGNGFTVSNSENNNTALTADLTVKNLQTMTTHDTQRWNNATATMSGIDQNGAAYWNASSTKQVQVNSAGFKTGVNDSTAYNFLSNTAVVNSFNDLSDPDDGMSLVGSGNEFNIGMFLKSIVNRPVALQMLRVGTNGGQFNTFVKPDGGSIFDATHVLPTPPYFVVDSPTNDATTYDTTSAMEISGGAAQNDALTLVGGSAGNAVNLNFYLRAITTRFGAIQVNTNGTNGGAMSHYLKLDGGGLQQVTKEIVGTKTFFDGGNFGATFTNASNPCETSYGTTTLGTGATTTATGQNCLPANSVIDAVVARVTTTITGACTGWSLGDGTTAARFTSNNTGLTAGTTAVVYSGTAWTTGIASTTTGMVQTSAHSITITCAGGNPSAGAIRIIVFSHTAAGPTS